MSEGGDHIPVTAGTAASSLNNGANIAEGSSPPQNMLPSNRQTARPEYKELAERPVHNWQATKTTVKDRLAYLFNNEVLCDVHFIVGRGINQQRIPAHRFILSAGSAVFDAMFNGTLATAAAEENLPDVEPAAFLSLLRFLYTDEVRICPDTVMTTLYTAKKYAVPALERHCVDFLKKNLSSDNAFLLLTQARLFDEPQLAALCLEMIDKNAADALSADGFTDIDLETLIYVLERDTLRAPEFKLYEAAERWAKAECLRKQENVTPTNMRRLLGGALQLIRFPLMRVEEFASGPAQSGLLTDREVVKLFLHFTVNPKPKAGFPENPRCCMSGTELTVSRFEHIENRWGYSGTSDRIRFSVDHRIFIAGLGLYGSIHGPAEYDADLQLFHANTGSVAAKNHTSFVCDGTDNTFRVLFKEPVEIQPNVWYIASSTLRGQDSFYGTKGMRRVTVNLPQYNRDPLEPSTVDKITFSFAYAVGQNNGTSVDDGQIPELIFYV